MTQRVGFIGLGIMGMPMAQHMLRGGCALHVFARNRSKAAALLVQGAAWHDTPRELAAHVDVLCLNVSDTPDVQQVLFGGDGAAEQLAAGSIVIDFSTIDASASREAAARLSQRGVHFLDAPVTGGDVGARNATHTIMVGGDRGAFEAALPLLQLVGRKVVHVGPSGSGQALKACNQVLCAVTLVGVCEALLLAQRSGLNLAQAVDTLSGGAGGSWAWSNLGQRIVDGDLQPAFMVKLMQKDLRLVQSAAREHQLPLLGTALAQQLLNAVEAMPGGGELGTQAMIAALRRLAGDSE